MGENHLASKIRALLQVAKYRGKLTAGIILGSVLVALLSGIGLGFILPVIEIVQNPNAAEEADGILLAFVTFYNVLNIPFTLGSIIVGVSIVLAARWIMTFLVRWFRGALVVDYTRELQTRLFDHTLDARLEYIDEEGSDSILNSIVTQTEYAARVIKYSVNLIIHGFLALIYLSVGLYIAPLLTVFTIIFFAGVSGLFRYILESGYGLGEKVAKANEGVQGAVQAGTQGIRDVKLFCMKNEIFGDFLTSVDQFAEAGIKQRRNEQAIQCFYNLLTAISIFIFIYLAIEFVGMEFGPLGIFLFAMFKLAPKASKLNSTLYRVENNLPHLIRTQDFVDELKQNRESKEAEEEVPENINSIRLDEVSFSYNTQEETAVSDLSLSIEKGEFIGIVGESGTGKSTIVSLLSRIYEADSGEIRANGKLINEMDVNEWRSQIAVVRQDPYIFNDTLKYNLTIGNRDVPQQELDRVCRIAKVAEFFDDLPNGYDTQLGDEGTRLSGGQRQRVALARALLKDAQILIQDEATSDLDSNLEKQVQASIENMKRNYITIGIAHRLSTIKNADRICTVVDGKISEVGSHEELIKINGKYAELYKIQSQSEQSLP